VILSGDKGSLYNGEEWKSSSLRGKVNLLFYVDPDKQDDVKPLVAKLDSIQYSPDSLGTTFIINTSATIIPNFILRNKIAERARDVKNMNYVLDLEQVLVHKWDLKDDDVNILLFDKRGKVLFKHAGNVTKDIVNKIIQKIELTLN
jgi:predicted transcriptional regulator